MQAELSTTQLNHTSVYRVFLRKCLSLTGLKTAQAAVEQIQQNLPSEENCNLSLVL